MIICREMFLSSRVLVSRYKSLIRIHRNYIHIIIRSAVVYVFYSIRMHERLWPPPPPQRFMILLLQLFNIPRISGEWWMHGGWVSGGWVDGVGVAGWRWSGMMMGEEMVLRVQRTDCRFQFIRTSCTDVFYYGRPCCN